MSSPSRRGVLALRAFTALVWLGVFTLTHLPPKDVPKTRISDKFAHFGAYALVGTLLYLCFWASRWSPWKAALIVVVIGCVYGAFDELTQPLVGRICDPRDWLADVAGMVTVAMILTAIRLIIPARQG